MTKKIPVNVLIIDDIAANRAVLKALLSSQDYRVVEASSGAEALRKLLDDEFAVLLLDVAMPDMNGFTLAELVRSRERTASVPIVYVTGVATDVELVFRGYRCGAVDYLIKPLEPEIVRAKVAVFAELYRQRKLIEAALREKDVLLREVHHRVKNNLQIVSSLLNLQGQRQAPPIRDLFLDSVARIRSIALVHECLYQTETVAAVDVDAYLRSIVNGLLQTHGSGQTAVEVTDHGVRFGVDVAIPCGLIVNELVSNALKHAFPGGSGGRVVVGASELPRDDYLLEVRDDGVGFPDSVQFSHGGTMGLELVQGLTEQLRGQIELDRTNGTVIHVRFPRSAQSKRF